MTHPVKSPKKLIEVALPLDAINVELRAKEKSIRHGHPSTLHLWWARRPLAAARAVIFAPAGQRPAWKWELEHPEEIPPSNLKASWAAEPQAALQDHRRPRAVGKHHQRGGAGEGPRRDPPLVARGLRAEQGSPAGGRAVQSRQAARAARSVRRRCGAIPLEAQRLGLEAYASDLNPVAVLINKAMIEIPPKFAGRPPVNPRRRRPKQDLVGREWQGAQGLAEDVRYYGQWMRDEAREAHRSPLSAGRDHGGDGEGAARPEAARRPEAHRHRLALGAHGQEPQPGVLACGCAACLDLHPLQQGRAKRPTCEPVVEGDRYRFTVKIGKPPAARLSRRDEAGRARNFRCLMSGCPDRLATTSRSEGQAGRMGARLMAIVAEGDRGRVYLATDDRNMKPSRARRSRRGSRMSEIPWQRTVSVERQALRNDRVGRSLHPTPVGGADNILATWSQKRASRVKRDALAAGMSDDDEAFEAGGTGATAYAEAVSVYLAFAVDQSGRLRIDVSATWRPRTRCACASTFGQSGDSDDVGFRGGESFACPARIHGELADGCCA